MPKSLLEELPEIVANAEAGAEVSASMRWIRPRDRNGFYKAGQAPPFRG
jgi:hypothetical protein